MTAAGGAVPLQRWADLRCEGVRVAFGERVALAGVATEVEPGVLLAVTGASGAGKSTLLAVLAGTQRPDDGVVTLASDADPDGSPLRSGDQAVRSGVALVPQSGGLALVLTAAENIALVLADRGVPGPEAVERAATALASVGLAEQTNRLVEELSGGQQQRVAVARALALRPTALLADEITSELDAQNRTQVMDLVRAEVYRGAGVLLATHDPQVAASCDGELHLVDGRADRVR